jgi:4-amino-4-deoxy-L-arabinose transferase-like glycosyltransferase
VNQNSLKSAYAVLIISLVNISVFVTLFFLRSFDDNRLTSWQWTFKPEHWVLFFPLLIFGLGLAYILSQIVSLNHKPIFLFLCAFLSTALFWQAPEVIVDASRYFTQAKHLNIYGIGYFFHHWGKDISVWTDMPLVPFLYGLIFKFFGEHRIYIQIFTSLLFSMTVILTYMIGARLWDKQTGLIGGLLLLGIPYLFSQVPLMLVDIPAMFFFTLSILAVINALEHGTIKWIGIATIALILVFYSKYSTWLWLSILIPICAVYLKINPRTTARRIGVIGGLSLIVIGLVILIYYDVLLDQLRLLISYQRPGLRRWGESFTSTFFFQIHPFITLFAAFSIYVAFRKKDLKYLIIIYLILLIFLMQIKRIRYTLPVMPMLVLMAAYGLNKIRSDQIKRFIVFSIVITSVSLAYFAYLPFLQRISTVNIKTASKFINSLAVDHIEVFTLPQKKSVINPAIAVALLDLYTDKQILYESSFEIPPNWDRIKTSALRFTWEHKNPAYYTKKKEDPAKSTAIVVISQYPNPPYARYLKQKTAQYKNFKIFKTVSGRFRYRTVVTVYYD